MIHNILRRGLVVSATTDSLEKRERELGEEQCPVAKSTLQSVFMTRRVFWVPWKQNSSVRQQPMRLYLVLLELNRKSSSKFAALNTVCAHCLGQWCQRVNALPSLARLAPTVSWPASSCSLCILSWNLIGDRYWTELVRLRCQSGHPHWSGEVTWLVAALRWTVKCLPRG